MVILKVLLTPLRQKDFSTFYWENNFSAKLSAVSVSCWFPASKTTPTVAETLNQCLNPGKRNELVMIYSHGIKNIPFSRCIWFGHQQPYPGLWQISVRGYTIWTSYQYWFLMTIYRCHLCNEKHHGIQCRAVDTLRPEPSAANFLLRNSE